MLVYILALPYFIFMYYLFRRGHSWTRACTGIAATKPFKWTLATVFLIMALSPAIAFFMPTGTVRHILNIAANFHLGIIIYLGGLVVLADFVKFILKKTGVISQDTLESRKIFATVGGIILISVMTICIYGGIHSKNIIIHEQTASVQKELKVDHLSSVKNRAENKMVIAVVADTHMAYTTGLKQIKTIVKEINSMQPDLVCMPGDFFTNVYDDVRQPDKLIEEFRKINSRYGVYGCWGNHDVDEPILAGFTFSGKNDHPKHDPRMISFLEKSNIKILEDEYILIDNKFYLAGRLDAEKPGTDQQRKTLTSVLRGINKHRPLIMIDHEPRELPENAKAGVDIDLSGHTHDGQFFPLNLTQYFIWKNPYGKMIFTRSGKEQGKKDHGTQDLQAETMTSLVTSGAGVYGPNMRVGTDSEVVKLTVTFK